MTGYDIVRSDRAFRWLAAAYLDELPERIHRTEHKHAGAFSDKMRRLLDDKYILWFQALGPAGEPLFNDDGSKKMTHHRPVSADDPDEFLMPAHEAVKRLRGTERPYPPEYRWLRSVMAWRGLPCMCNHPSIVEHIAAVDRVHIHDVVTVVRGAAARAVATIERAGALPDTPQTAPPRKTAWRARRSSAIAALPRVYEP